jgi:hypothetical protein
MIPKLYREYVAENDTCRVTYFTDCRNLLQYHPFRNGRLYDETTGRFRSSQIPVGHMVTPRPDEGRNVVESLEKRVLSVRDIDGIEADRINDNLPVRAYNLVGRDGEPKIVFANPEDLVYPLPIQSAKPFLDYDVNEIISKLGLSHDKDPIKVGDKVCVERAKRSAGLTGNNFSVVGITDLKYTEFNRLVYDYEVQARELASAITNIENAFKRKMKELELAKKEALRQAGQLPDINQVLRDSIFGKGGKIR